MERRKPRIVRGSDRRWVLFVRVARSFGGYSDQAFPADTWADAMEVLCDLYRYGRLAS